MTPRFHLSTNGNHIDMARTHAGAFVKAVYQSKINGTRVRVYDRYAHRGRVNLWELRPDEMFPRVVAVKRVN